MALGFLNFLTQILVHLVIFLCHHKASLAFKFYPFIRISFFSLLFFCIFLILQFSFPLFLYSELPVP